MVPLADSTIFEMEKRGEFPPRFNLSPRGVVWDLAEVEAWLEQRHTAYFAGQVDVASTVDVRHRKMASGEAKGLVSLTPRRRATT